MKPQVKKIILLLVCFLILISYFPLVNLLTLDNHYDETKYNILRAERDSLKESLENITSLNYDAYNYVYGKVVLREMYNFTEELVIKTNDKVKPGNLVVNNNGVVGVIEKVNRKTSLVKLLTNKDTSLSIIINDSYGKLTFNGHLIIEDIPKDKVNIGDEVYTSGLTKYPKGLLIGKVTNIGKYIEIESSSLTNIRDVLILKGEE